MCSLYIVTKYFIVIFTIKHSPCKPVAIVSPSPDTLSIIPTSPL